MKLNDTVTVRLNLTGRQILEQYDAKMAARLHESVRVDLLRSKSVGPDGAYTAMLWEVMNIFGGHVTMGREFPFVGGEIIRAGQAA